MPTVKVTFVQATYVLATFVHFSNISAVTDPILTKLFGPIFLGLNIFWQTFFFGKTSFDLNIYCTKIFCTQSFLHWPQIVMDKKSLCTNIYLRIKKNLPTFFGRHFLYLNFSCPIFLGTQNNYYNKTNNKQKQQWTKTIPWSIS